MWLYILFGFLIAISVTFPLFLIAREMRLAKLEAVPAGVCGAYQPAFAGGKRPRDAGSTGTRG